MNRMVSSTLSPFERTLGELEAEFPRPPAADPQLQAAACRSTIKRMDKSILIIGGGLTGLSAGCYGRMNGYRTTIFEMHSMAGGVCTAWKRKGYTIDGAMNWLMGSNPKSGGYRIWEELGAAPGWKIHNHEFNATFENRQGKAFTVYCDADRFEQYLLELAPEDAAVIKELTGMIRYHGPGLSGGQARRAADDLRQAGDDEDVPRVSPDAQAAE